MSLGGKSFSARGRTIRWKEASALNPWKRHIARRHQKKHERMQAERARQKALEEQDAQESVRNVAHGSAAAQGLYPWQ